MSAPEIPPPLECDGAALLDELRDALTSYVVFPSSEAADAVALYVAATHAQSCWEHATRLAITSPIKRCGKTRLLEIISELVYRPLRTINISPAALVRSIDEQDPPTIILDEADTVFASRRGDRAEGAEDIRGILNAGHSRGWPYTRWNAAARCTEECFPFAMAIIGGIGDLPDTIEDRAVIIRMRRRAGSERVLPFRRRRSVPALRDLRERLHDWLLGLAPKLMDAEPQMPVEDRNADTWEPLVAVADAAGGSWPVRARVACAVLCRADWDAAEASPGEKLLADLRAIFEGSHCLYTSTIIDKLLAIDEAPWATWNRGLPLNARAMASLLRPYGIRTSDVREGGTGANRKGLRRSDLNDAWARYLTEEVAPASVGDIRDTATSSDESSPVQGESCRG